MVHVPDVRACAECEALRRLDGLELARFVAVEHRIGYSVLVPAGDHRRASEALMEAPMTAA